MEGKNNGGARNNIICTQKNKNLAFNRNVFRNGKLLSLSPLPYKYILAGCRRFSCSTKPFSNYRLHNSLKTYEILLLLLLCCPMYYRRIKTSDSLLRAFRFQLDAYN